MNDFKIGTIVKYYEVSPSIEDSRFITTHRGKDNTTNRILFVNGTHDWKHDTGMKVTWPSNHNYLIEIGRCQLLTIISNPNEEYKW